MAGTMHENDAFVTPHQRANVLTYRVDGDTLAASHFHDNHGTSFCSLSQREREWKPPAKLAGVIAVRSTTPDADQGTSSRWFPPDPACSSWPARRCQLPP